ncbi:Putative glyoxalase/Bleomycin resistance protein/Dihydroxybiphenyl dioxygenase [Septoria linicola]|uniref:Glyoxalase/Bleomycin resistance protein/Dihydroxybiphenyl dioxygenase n=1 Tax=Septoria linicola TaxID=215465 RepID=A0A9Q9EQL1_9PEZI|nr:putative glyoxalase/Bleomycin resistance protein/Dihydroxybiphenyl dioxygenase [Septoria linicola]USW58889.1 Putative glyoxalase/Bleomycin resistance protein/Dihydroxybiphenyl dioxygenase [Septoria linicola]
MPVSHLGLTVSHIPTATSFYLAALQPLGYRFIGHQGHSIGFGVESADFFITQAPIGARPSPNHIAFLAEDRNVVRDCYTASLQAGGSPSGAPSYRNEECSCFNAAVEDHDGNTIEFIFRQPHGEGIDDGNAEDDAQSVARSVMSRGSQVSKATTTKSRMQTALDLAKSTSQSAKSVVPSASSSFPSKAILGTALGAAAGAALMFAMTREESKNAKDEADHLAYMSSPSRADSRYPRSEAAPPVPPIRAETMPPSMPVFSQAPKSEARTSRRFHHNYSTTESAYSRPQPRSTQAMRMLQETGYNDDAEVQEVMSRYTNLRPHPTRSHTIDDAEYAPDRVPAMPSVGSAMKRASTLPIDAEIDRSNYYLEAPRSTVSKHSSRRGGDDGDDHRSSASHRSHRRTSADDTDRLKRHDSGASMHSSRSHRERGSEAGRRSSASTIKPSRRGSDAIPLPPPPIGNHAPSQASRGGSSCYHPAAISLPASAASSNRKTSIREEDDPRHSSAPNKPYLHERDSVLQSWEDFEAEESDGMGDIKTVLPEDSISCVDLSRPRKHRSHHHHSSKHSSSGRHSRSGRSEASERTVRPAVKERKGSLLGLPIRSKEGSRFSFV